MYNDLVKTKGAKLLLHLRRQHTTHCTCVILPKKCYLGLHSMYRFSRIIKQMCYVLMFMYNYTHHVKTSLRSMRWIVTPQYGPAKHEICYSCINYTSNYPHQVETLIWSSVKKIF